MLFVIQALSARKVIGIEMVQQAVEDAQVNAEINGEQKCVVSQVLCLKCEIISSTLVPCFIPLSPGLPSSLPDSLSCSLSSSPLSSTSLPSPHLSILPSSLPLSLLPLVHSSLFSPFPLSISLPSPPLYPSPFPSSIPFSLPLLCTLLPSPPLYPSPFPPSIPFSLPLLYTLLPSPPLYPSPFPSSIPFSLPLLYTLLHSPPLYPSPFPLLSSLPSPPPGVSNAVFVCGKAEDVMSGVQLPWVRNGELIGIVDPPRGGLRKYMHSLTVDFRCVLFEHFVFHVQEIYAL